MILSAALVLGSCGAGQSKSAAAGKPVDPPKREHHWTTKEGQEYAYEAVVSEDDRQAGILAGDVIMIRYLGVRQGQFTVASVDRNANAATVASCPNPCQIVKVIYQDAYGAETKHITYNPDTVIGGALEDAFNNQLELYHREPPAAPPSQGRVADTSIAY